MTVVMPRLVLSLLPDSMRLSSNMTMRPAQPYVFLDTACCTFAPKPGLHPTRQFDKVNPLKYGMPQAIALTRPYFATPDDLAGLRLKLELPSPCLTEPGIANGCSPPYPCRSLLCLCPLQPPRELYPSSAANPGTQPESEPRWRSKNMSRSGFPPPARTRSREALHHRTDTTLKRLEMLTRLSRSSG